MKKLLVILFILFSISTVSAQGFYFGPTGGVNVSSLTKQSYSESRVRGNVGVFVGYKISNIFTIQAEGLYSWQGAKYANSDRRLSFNYIKVPVVAKMFIVGGLNVEAGVSFNFLMNSRVKYTDASGNEVDINTTSASNKFDLSIPIGINYLIAKKVEIGLRYDISTVKVWKEEDNKSANTSLSLNVRVRF